MVSIAAPPKDWTDVIGDIAEQFMNARVCFYEEGVPDPANPYDPITGTGAESAVRIIWVGNARVQQLLSTQKFATEYQADASRVFRFQISKSASVPFLSQGVAARVLNAGVPGAGMTPGDEDLTQLAYVVDSSINGSHQAVKTVMLTANMAPVSWSWNVDENGVVV